MPKVCTTEVAMSTVILNGSSIPVTKNPKYKRGEPNVKSNTSFVGSKPVVTKKLDFTDAQGTVTISIRNTKENIERIEECQDNPCGNSIMIIDATGLTKTFTELSIEEDPEWDLDGDETEITFKGGQAK